MYFITCTYILGVCKSSWPAIGLLPTGGGGEGGVHGGGRMRWGGGVAE